MLAQTDFWPEFYAVLRCLGIHLASRPKVKRKHGLVGWNFLLYFCFVSLISSMFAIHIFMLLKAWNDESILSVSNRLAVASNILVFSWSLIFNRHQILQLMDILCLFRISFSVHKRIILDAFVLFYISLCFFNCGYFTQWDSQCLFYVISTNCVPSVLDFYLISYLVWFYQISKKIEADVQLYLRNSNLNQLEKQTWYLTKAFHLLTSVR